MALVPLNKSTTKHLPSFLFHGTVTLYVGPNHKRMEIHKKLLASISPELNKHVNNHMREGIEGKIRLPDEEEEVLTLFTEWAYTGDYAQEDGTRLAKDRSYMEQTQDPWSSLHKHLQLYAFADKFNVAILKQLAESKFHTEIDPIEPSSSRDVCGLVMVIRYAYDNLPSSDPILKFLAQYASWKLDLLRTSKRFNKLLLSQPDFLKELLMNLQGRRAKPAAPQKRPTYERDEGRPYRTTAILIASRVY
ncbi:hypothetical protein B9Z19DRAFT_1065571 [Tuber borchii]|uniref:BTB domain-containing protein n=1 Tax=Tuber borchii TaxID=42251 RepID=A0A2T6ZQJ5_TUBBO|nr:hypothetical protein B9Z19DRAFT_1065571 [Tuber borchii]